MQNSYGDFSHYLTAGFNLKETKKSQLSLHLVLQITTAKSTGIENL